MFINLTPHAVNILDGDGNPIVVVSPSGETARCSTSTVPVCTVDGVNLSKVEFGEVVGLPEQKDGVIYIVSMLVRSAVPHRTDVASPGELIRSPDGQPLGCKGLTINA